MTIKKQYNTIEEAKAVINELTKNRNTLNYNFIRADTRGGKFKVTLEKTHTDKSKLDNFLELYKNSEARIKIKLYYEKPLQDTIFLTIENTYLSVKWIIEINLEERLENNE